MRLLLAVILLFPALALADFHFERAINSEGPKFEISYGWARGTIAPDGTWWERQFETDNSVSSSAYSIGVSDKVIGPWGVRVDIAQLLRYHTRNVAIPNEQLAQQFADGMISCASPDTCLSKWNGDGKAYGVHMGIFREFATGAMKIQPEFGMLLYHYTFDMTLEGLQPGALNGPISTDTGSQDSYTPYARMTMLLGHWFLRGDYDHNVKGHHPVVGIQQGKILSLSLGYQF